MKFFSIYAQFFSRSLHRDFKLFEKIEQINLSFSNLCGDNNKLLLNLCEFSIAMTIVEYYFLLKKRVELSVKWMKLIKVCIIIKQQY